MLAKAITYTDFNDQQQTETFYFNFTLPELLQKEAESGSYIHRVQRIIDTDDRQEILAQIKWIVLGSVGMRSDDGKRFIKSEEISRNFEQHAAFEALYTEFITNADAAGNFWNAVLPKSLEETARKSQAAQEQVEQRSGRQQLADIGVPDEVIKQFPAPTPAS